MTQQDETDPTSTRWTDAAPVTVDVHSDVICPWCYIGSRRLTAAVARFSADGGPSGAVPVHVRWHAFELNPDMPVPGRDRREYRSAKFGSWRRSQQLDAQVTAVGAEEGLELRHDLMTRTPNTRAAHRLIWLAQQRGLGAQMVERLFAGYFTRGLDVGDPSVLVDLAGAVGLPGDDAAGAVRAAGPLGERAEAGVAAAVRRGRELRITSVPFSVFGEAYTLPPGAQPADVIAQVLRVVRQDQHRQGRLPARAGADDERAGGADATPGPGDADGTGR
jgi:predicted DsbA family dithiol-disulfide isomerase